MAKAGIPEAKIVAALRKWGGMSALAAKELGITRQAVHQRLKNSATIRAAVAEIEEETLDIGEGHLIKLVRNGDKEMVKYYLDRKGRRRGYGNSVNVGLDEAQAEALIASLGGNVEAYRAALRQLGVPESEIP
jgi:hypothetical protein